MADSSNAINIGDPGEDETKVDASIARKQYLEQMEAAQELEDSGVFVDSTKVSDSGYPERLKEEGLDESGEFEKVDKPTDIPPTEPTLVSGAIENTPEESEVDDDISTLSPEDLKYEGQLPSDHPDAPKKPFWQHAQNLETGEIEELKPSDIIQVVEHSTEKATRATPPPLPNEQRDSTPEISVKEEEVESSGEIQIDFDETEFAETEDTEIQEFIKKEKLEGNDAFVLAKLLLRHPKDIHLLNFIEKISETQLDFEIFVHNSEIRDPEEMPALIQSILIVGANKELSEEGGRIYNPIDHRKQGFVGHITIAEMASKDSLDLQKVAIKTLTKSKKPERIEQSKMSMGHERVIARIIERYKQNNPDDPRLKHIVTPLYVGKEVLIMPYISHSNREGVRDLDEIEDGKEWAECLAGSLKGATLLGDMEMINLDLKPSNICEADAGGVLIDWGGFTHETSNICGFTEAFCNKLIYALELQEGKAARDLVHKFIIQRILEYRLLMNVPLKGNKGQVLDVEGLKKHRKLYKKLSDQEKLNYPTLDFDESEMEPGDQLLYQLYKKLNQVYLHPTEFTEKEGKRILDPEYYSLEHIILDLERASNYY